MIILMLTEQVIRTLVAPPLAFKVHTYCADVQVVYKSELKATPSNTLESPIDDNISYRPQWLEKVIKFEIHGYLPTFNQTPATLLPPRSRRFFTRQRRPASPLESG